MILGKWRDEVMSIFDASWRSVGRLSGDEEKAKLLDFLEDYKMCVGFGSEVL